MPLEKLSEIEEKLQKDYIDIKKRYIKLKRCKYALLILKTTLISLSIGLSFINPILVKLKHIYKRGRYETCPSVTVIHGV